MERQFSDPLLSFIYCDLGSQFPICLKTKKFWLSSLEFKILWEEFSEKFGLLKDLWDNDQEKFVLLYPFNHIVTCLKLEILLYIILI